MEHTMVINTPIGKLRLVEENGSIVQIHFMSTQMQESPCAETPVLADAAKQLEEYFAGVRKEFTLPLGLAGTEFQTRVWAALCQIPYGETRSYKQVAQMIGKPSAARAVGMANNKNPVPIVVPCHRVVGANGSLTGYAGGLDIKEKLLGLERGTV